MSAEEAERHAEEVLASRHLDDPGPPQPADDHDGIGTPWGAAWSSFLFFAAGALLPVLPYLAGADGFPAVAIASAAVGIALLAAGAFVGLLSGGSLLKRAIRQLAIGVGAALVTYLVGLAFGTVVR